MTKRKNPIIENSVEIIEDLESQSDDAHHYNQIALDYLRNIDGALIDLGWGFDGAKTVEFGHKDQSLLNHVRNGVFFLLHLNEVAGRSNERHLSPEELRDVVAMFIAHDLHKIRDTEGANEEFEIPRKDVEGFVDKVDLLSFGDGVTVEDLWSCACAHHDTWNAKTGKETLAFKDLKYYVRLADSFASSPTPEDAVNKRSIKALDDVFYENLDLGYHSLDETTGILTNLLNAAVADLLSDYNYEVIAIYQDGCVYIKKNDREPDVNEGFVEEVYDRFTEKVRNSHHSYTNAVSLSENINTVYNLGYYSPSEEDFFYAGPEMVIKAIAHKAAADGDVDNDPTGSMIDSIEEVEELLDVELDRTRQLIGVARLVGGIKKTVITELDVDDEIKATAEVFDASDQLLDSLDKVGGETHDKLTSGGKFDYSYAIAQELLDTEVDGVNAKDLSPDKFSEQVGDLLVENLSQIEGWDTIDDSVPERCRNIRSTDFGVYLVPNCRAGQSNCKVSRND